MGIYAQKMLMNHHLHFYEVYLSNFIIRIKMRVQEFIAWRNIIYEAYIKYL